MTNVSRKAEHAGVPPTTDLVSPTHNFPAVPNEDAAAKTLVQQVAPIKPVQQQQQQQQQQQHAGHRHSESIPPPTANHRDKMQEGEGLLFLAAPGPPQSPIKVASVLLQNEATCVHRPLHHANGRYSNSGHVCRCLWLHDCRSVPLKLAVCKHH